MSNDLKIVLLAVLFSFTVLCMSGCDDLTTEGQKGYEKHSRLCSIENQSDLYYCNDTKIIYIIFNEESGIGYNSHGYGYMAPYYSDNGNLCKYIDGKIIEVKNE